MARTTKRMHWAKTWTGGGTGAADKIDGNKLIDLDGLIVIQANMTTFHSLDDDASGTESPPAIINPDANKGTKSWILTGITVPNTGLHILDTNASHDLIIAPGSDLTADRTLTITTGDANRTVTLNENLTIGDGTDITITGVTAARTLILNENLTIGDGTDVTITSLTQANTLTLNESLTVGDGYSGTITFSADAKVLTVDESETISNYLKRAVYDAYSILAADTDNTPAAVTLAASEMIGRKATGGIVALAKADVLTIINVTDGADVTGDNAPQAHTASHAVGGADTIFPADPGADKVLLWDDSESALAWSDAGTGDVTAAANITDHRLVRGDGGAKGIQESLASIDDSGNIVLPDGGTIGTSDPDAIAISAAGILTFSGQSSCGARLTSNQTITTGTWTKLILATEFWDVQNEFDSATNYRFTASTAGKYLATACGYLVSMADGDRLEIAFKKSGSYYGADANVRIGSAGVAALSMSAIFDLGASDYLELEIYHDHGSDLTAQAGDNINTFFVAKIA